MSETELAAAKKELAAAVAKTLRDFLYGPVFRPFMVTGWAVCVGLGIYGLITLKADYAVALIIAQAYGYFAWHGPPGR